MNLEEEIQILKKRWQYLFDDPEGVRSLLLLYINGKGTRQDFETMVDRIIESRSLAKAKPYDRQLYTLHKETSTKSNGPVAGGQTRTSGEMGRCIG